MKTPKDKDVYNMEQMRVYNTEKKVFDNIKSPNLSEETFANFNSIIQKEQQKQKRMEDQEIRGLQQLATNLSKEKNQQNKKHENKKKITEELKVEKEEIKGLQK